MGWVILLVLVLIFWLWVSDYPRAPHGEDLARRKGQQGEAIVRDILLQSCRERTGHVLSNVTLPWQGRTTQIDHILIHPSGIFVFEVKHRRGQVHAVWNHPTWTQVTPRGLYEFQNPLFQNHTHVRAVAALFPEGRFVFPVTGRVVLTGDVQLTPNWPAGVYRASELLPLLRQEYRTALTPAMMSTCLRRIEAVRKPATKRTERQHIAYVKSVQRRFNSYR